MTITAVIAPDLTVTGAQYELAAAGLAEHSPGVTLTWEQWITPARWGLVPDEHTGRCYKAEYTLRDHDTEPPGDLVRINIWFEPDLRGGQAPTPHSHPWPFVAHVLAGGYDEDRYALEGGHVALTRAQHGAGAGNDMPRALYHEVTALHDAPGLVITLMVASAAGERGGWGYLDPETGLVQPASAPSPAWLDAWRRLNPHR